MPWCGEADKRALGNVSHDKIQVMGRLFSMKAMSLRWLQGRARLDGYHAALYLKSLSGQGATC